MAKPNGKLKVAEEIRYPVMGQKLFDVEELRKDPRNARTHGERNIKAIVASLERFGQRKNIVVDRHGIVIAGNGTLEAASRLGWKQIAGAPAPTKKIDARAFALADNRSAELAEWDNDLLRNDITDILSNGYDIEQLTALGFGQSEIAGHLRTEPLEGAPQLGGMNYSVIVDCKNEREQTKLLTKFEKDGLKARPLIT